MTREACGALLSRSLGYCARQSAVNSARCWEHREPTQAERDAMKAKRQAQLAADERECLRRCGQRRRAAEAREWFGVDVAHGIRNRTTYASCRVAGKAVRLYRARDEEDGRLLLAEYDRLARAHATAIRDVDQDAADLALTGRHAIAAALGAYAMAVRDGEIMGR